MFLVFTISDTFNEDTIIQYVFGESRVEFKTGYTLIVIDCNTFTKSQVDTIMNTLDGTTYVGFNTHDKVLEYINNL